jgi:hypothetical protein
MALANATAVSVATATWTTVASVTGDGTKQVIGFALKCDDATVAFEARLQIGGTTTIAGVAALAGDSAQVYDAPTTIGNAVACVVQVLHAAGVNKNFTGTLLGS